MAPQKSAGSSGDSNGKKRKRGQASLAKPEWHNPAGAYNSSMDVDNASEGHSSTSSYPLDPNILNDFDISRSGWVDRKEEDIPQDLGTIQAVGDASQPQAYLSWRAPLQPVGEGVETAQTAAGAAPKPDEPAAGRGDPDEVSTSYATGTTCSDDLLNIPIEDWDPATLQFVRDALGDPWFGITILYTKHGFPYSFFETGTKRCVCRWPKCKQTIKEEMFENLASLIKHQKNHQTKDKMPFKCDVCPEAFALCHYLIRHKLKHSDIRPWQCGGCRKSFKRKDALDKHQKSETACAKVRRKSSTISGSEAPRTPGTLRKIAPSRPSKGKERASSSATQPQSPAIWNDQVEIQSNQSYPFPFQQDRGPYFGYGSVYDQQS